MGAPVATALAHVNDTPPALPDSVPADLRAVVGACLAKSPEDRPADAREVAVALGMPADPVKPVVAVAAATTRLSTVTPATPRWQTRAQALAHGGDTRARRPRPLWLIAPVAALLVIAGAVGLGSLFSSDERPATTPPAASVASTPATTPSATTPAPTTTTTAAAPAQAPAPAPVKPAPADKGKGKPEDPGKGKGNK
jgi:serine/threonine-protein kinase